MQPDKTRDVTLLRLALSLVGLSDRRKGHNNRTEPISQSRERRDAHAAFFYLRRLRFGESRGRHGDGGQTQTSDGPNDRLKFVFSRHLTRKS